MARVTMPQLGESVAEGTIGRWLKKPGDHVDLYEPLVEVITDKVNAEVPSPVAGTLTEILVAEGTTVPNLTEIAVILAPGELVAGVEAATAAPSVPAVPEAEAPSAGPRTLAAPEVTPAAAASAVSAVAAQASTGTDEAGHDARMTPAVRRLLREHGLRADQVAGTGGGGRITRDDVMAHVEAADGSKEKATAAPPAPVPTAAAATPAATTDRASRIEYPPGADEVLIPASKMRTGIANQMVRALAVPHAYVHVEVDASALVRVRQGARSEFEAREGIPLSYVPFVVMACVHALKRHPLINAHWTEQGLMAQRRVNIGVAVALPDGLIVPVIHDADQLSISGLSHAIVEVAGRARDGRFRLSDFGGGTFTVDNTGALGSNLTMPIINVPEVAIITMEAIVRRPVVVRTADGEAIAIRSMMNMVLAIDHRANDGAEAAAFLHDVKAWLEALGPEIPLS